MVYISDPNNNKQSENLKIIFTSFFLDTIPDSSRPKPDCMVKIMKALESTQVASSQPATSCSLCFSVVIDTGPAVVLIFKRHSRLEELFGGQLGIYTAKENENLK